jgi:hypothetical protein
MSEFANYIGIPWEEGGEGPDAFDCMAFVGHIQRKHFGVELPKIVIPDYQDRRSLVGLIGNHPENKNWLPVDAPRHGDSVLVRSPAHYGVWLDIDGGGVLHCLRGAGVVFTTAASWATSGLGRRQYLRHRSKV